MILALLLMLAADPVKPVEPPKPVPASEKARADYWRGMYAKLAAQIQMREADTALNAAVAALCDAKHEPVPGENGEPMCRLKTAENPKPQLP